tara:strand:- start:6 stop:245 length:240 start_codon:yes stop_codon:yes gene_type:complete
MLILGQFNLIKLGKMWRIWKYALGSFNDDKTKKYDDVICIIRSSILLGYMVTNCFITAGVIRHWNHTQTVVPDTLYVRK